MLDFRYCSHSFKISYASWYTLVLYNNPYNDHMTIYGCVILPFYSAGTVVRFPQATRQCACAGTAFASARFVIGSPIASSPAL